MSRELIVYKTRRKKDGTIVLLTNKGVKEVREKKPKNIRTSPRDVRKGGKK